MTGEVDIPHGIPLMLCPTAVLHAKMRYAGCGFIFRLFLAQVASLKHRGIVGQAGRLCFQFSEEKASRKDLETCEKHMIKYRPYKAPLHTCFYQACT